MQPVLAINNLQINFDIYAGVVQAVRGVSFTVNPGEAVALVGESGCGKSVTAQAIMGLISSPPCRVVNGEILFGGQDLLKFSEVQMQGVRGKQIGMIFQDPMTALNPTITVGKQIAEGLRKHQGLAFSQAMEQARELLNMVGVPQSNRRIKHYPHEFSGGMRQRVMIAIALACRPKLLIADEPTTALDVTIQAQIINLIRNLQRNLGMAVMLITHDLGVVAGLCSQVVVMYGGQIMEAGPVREIYYRPGHPYTKGLLAAIPKINQESKPLASIPGTPPDLINPPTGCPFAARCPNLLKICTMEAPLEQEVSTGHRVACWLLHPLAGRI
ncbi:MAG: ABC transporter ATP-binding protein [Carboxydocellales bacterium]